MGAVQLGFLGNKHIDAILVLYVNKDQTNIYIHAQFTNYS